MEKDPKKTRTLRPLTRRNFKPDTPPKNPGKEPPALPSLAEDYNILDLQMPLDQVDAQELDELDPSNELTPQEERLVAIYLDHPDQPKQILVELAGYKAKSDKVRVSIFNRVIAKWEKGVHRLDIFRKAGLGELRIALRIRQLALQNTNLKVAADMVVHASKIMDLVNPALDLADGFEIRVKRAAAPAKPVETGPARAKLHKVEKKVQVKD